MSSCPIPSKEALLDSFDVFINNPPKTPLTSVFFLGLSLLAMTHVADRFSEDDDFIDPVLKTIDITADIPATTGEPHIDSAIQMLAIFCVSKKTQPNSVFDQKASVTLKGLFDRCARHDRAGALKSATEFASKDRFTPPGSLLRATAEQAVRDLTASLP